MVTIEKLEKDFMELFSALLGQELAEVSPKDTGHMARTFLTTREVKGNKIFFTVPYYWKFVEYGTIKMSARPFVRLTLENKTDEIAEKTLKIISQRD